MTVYFVFLNQEVNETGFYRLYCDSVRIFENGARYRIVELSPSNCMNWLKTRIAQDYAEKARLTDEMERWYGSGKSSRFPQFNELHDTTARLSRMDTSFKTLWDAHHGSLT